MCCLEITYYNTLVNGSCTGHLLIGRKSPSQQATSKEGNDEGESVRAIMVKVTIRSKEADRRFSLA